MPPESDGRLIAPRRSAASLCSGCPRRAAGEVDREPSTSQLVAARNRRTWSSAVVYDTRYSLCCIKDDPHDSNRDVPRNEELALSMRKTPRWGQGGAGGAGRHVPTRCASVRVLTELVLVGGFWVDRWRTVVPLASPVTPEVAGSSPVAPVPRSRRKAAFHLSSAYGATKVAAKVESSFP
jgi:hypothetical protein